jgi:hypothetical protein
MTPSWRVTSHDISACASAPQIAGVGGFQEGPSTVLKFVYDTGDSDIVCLDDRAILHLVGVLKTLVPDIEAIDRRSVLVELEGGLSAWSPG